MEYSAFVCFKCVLHRFETLANKEVVCLEEEEAVSVDRERRNMGT
jgi:hypothetical protein